MKSTRLCLLAAALVLCASPASAQNSQQPPLIDREIFFGDVQDVGGQQQQ